MLALALSLVFALLAGAPAPGGAPDWEPATAAAHHEAFLYRMLAAHWGEPKTQERFRGAATKPRPATTQAAFPIDKVRGVYTNTPQHRATATWRAIGLEAWPEDDVGANKLGALFELDYHFEYGFNDDTAPVACVPAASPAQGYHGAAACYFAIRSEYFEPGFWVALREVDGHVVVAGVFEHKVALEEPAKDRKLAAFLAAIDKKFTPSPH